MTYDEKFKTYPKVYQDLIVELAYEYEVSTKEIEDNLSEYLVINLDGYIARSSRRHWDDITMILFSGNRYFQFEWAIATGDTSIEDLGWKFDKSSVVEVERIIRIVTQEEITYKPIKQKGNNE